MTSENKERHFAEAKRAVETYLHQRGVTAEIYLSDNLPAKNLTIGKYKHIIAMWNERINKTEWKCCSVFRIGTACSDEKTGMAFAMPVFP